MQYPNIARVPFPAKKTFQNTERSVLEHRMVVLNEFLREIGLRSEDNHEIYTIVRDFLEPDTNDKKLHGGTVIRTVLTGSKFLNGNYGYFFFRLKRLLIQLNLECDLLKICQIHW